MDELVQFQDQCGHIHIMHQSAVFQRIEGNRKTTATAHLHIVKKFDRLRVGTDYLVNRGVFLDNHETKLPNSLAEYIAVMLASIVP
jgi:hypothetical protein